MLYERKYTNMKGNKRARTKSNTHFIDVAVVFCKCYK